MTACTVHAIINDKLHQYLSFQIKAPKGELAELHWQTVLFSLQEKGKPSSPFLKAIEVQVLLLHFYSDLNILQIIDLRPKRVKHQIGHPFARPLGKECLFLENRTSGLHSSAATTLFMALFLFFKCPSRGSSTPAGSLRQNLKHQRSDAKADHLYDKYLNCFPSIPNPQYCT